MRQIFLDTETTGFGADDRIIEIAALSYENYQPREDGIFHQYCNPQCGVSPGALNVHGMDNDFLADKPLFADIADDLQAFLRGSEVIIHNASFDCRFLDSEFSRLAMPPMTAITDQVVCSLTLSRQRYPTLGGHSLTNLCRCFGIDDSDRTAHGALVDARLLAQVYFAMGRK